jgi:hypothetical protein
MHYQRAFSWGLPRKGRKPGSGFEPKYADLLPTAYPFSATLAQGKILLIGDN